MPSTTPDLRMATARVSRAGIASASLASGGDPTGSAAGSRGGAFAVVSLVSSFAFGPAFAGRSAGHSVSNSGRDGGSPGDVRQGGSGSGGVAGLVSAGFADGALGARGGVSGDSGTSSLSSPPVCKSAGVGANVEAVRVGTSSRRSGIVNSRGAAAAFASPLGRGGNWTRAAG